MAGLNGAAGYPSADRVYDARMAGRWASILICLAAALLLIVLIDGWAIAFLPRLIEKLVLSAAFVVLVVLAVLALTGRDGDRGPGDA